MLILALIFITPLLIGIATGNGRSYFELTLLSLVIWPVWFLMAAIALDDIRR